MLIARGARATALMLGGAFLLLCVSAHADGTIQVAPSSVQGDTTLANTGQLCIYDGLGSPIRGVQITWTASPGYGGSVTVNGQSGAGTISPLTGTNGCVTLSSITSRGIPPTGGTYHPVVTFSADPPVVPAAHYTGTLGLNVGTMTLVPNPSALYGNVSSQPVSVTLTNLAGGGTAAGITTQASCGGTNGLTASVMPSSANVSGSGSTASATFSVTVGGAEIAVPGAPTPTGSCAFTVPPNGPAATVSLGGVNVCSLTRLSPPDPRCGSPVANPQ
jgi:hypothetical protein